MTKSLQNQRPLFIFEMANNHMGDIAHGHAIIRAFAEVCTPYRDHFDFAFKLQYRDLDTFIHPMYQGREDIKYVKRFEETRLSDADFIGFVATMRECGFTPVCTPFDEVSVGKIVDQGIEVIKIASCSLTDWPLLERIAAAKLPVIASTAGATPEEVDTVVSFFQHRGTPLTIMHCVAEYPTPDDNLHIARIDALRQRYPEVRVGFSTHENPDRTEPVMIAAAKGAKVFEKHVGLPTDKYALNAYSASPAQIARWLAAAKLALDLCGNESWPQASADETASLHSLRRGVFLTADIKAGEEISSDKVCFAFPPVPGQLTANQWSKYSRYTATQDLQNGTPLLADSTTVSHQRESILAAVGAVKSLLSKGNIIVPGKSELEISHHYGMERFAEFGLTMVTVVNREYCKKLLVLLPGQEHPEQFHKIKEETFVVLHGEITIWLDGVEQLAKPGDVITVSREVRHRFASANGAVFEEISSTHHGSDSYYTDTSIAANTRRKTHLTYWL